MSLPSSHPQVENYWHKAQWEDTLCSSSHNGQNDGSHHPFLWCQAASRSIVCDFLILYWILLDCHNIPFADQSLMTRQGDRVEHTAFNTHASVSSQQGQECMATGSIDMGGRSVCSPFQWALIWKKSTFLCALEWMRASLRSPFGAVTHASPALWVLPADMFIGETPSRKSLSCFRTL